MELSEDTLFIGNIARGVHEDELKEVFGEYGSLRGCFLIAEKYGPNRGQSKGYGFVQYVNQEDCEAALKYLQGKEMNGQKLVLDKAGNKGYKPNDLRNQRKRRTDEMSKTTQPKVETKNKKQKTKETVFDQLAKEALKQISDDNFAKEDTEVKKVTKLSSILRDSSVVVFGIPACAIRKQLLRAMAKFGKVNAIELPATSLRSGWMTAKPTDERPQRVACLIVFTKPSSAGQAIRKLNGTKLKVKVLDKDGKRKVSTCFLHLRRLTSLSSAENIKKHNKVIARNLPFSLSTESQLFSHFASIGPIAKVKLEQDRTASAAEPTEADAEKSVKIKHRGFGFVEFLCREDAKKACKELNGHVIHKRKIAVDMALSTTQYKKLMNEEAKAMEETEPSEVLNKESDIQEDKATDASEQEHEEEEEALDKRSDQELSASVDSAEEDSDGEDDKKQHKIAPSSEEEISLTLFVRNLPFESAQDDVFELFNEFGPVRYVKIVMDENGRSRGSCFVNYYHKGSFERAIAASKSLLGEGETGHEAGQAGTLFLNGRPLQVSNAVAKTEARRLTSIQEATDENGNRKKRFERRHVYLLSEGVIHKHQMAPTKTLKEQKKTKKKPPKRTTVKSCNVGFDLFSPFMKNDKPIQIPRQSIKKATQDMAQYYQHSGTLKTGEQPNDQIIQLPKADVAKRLANQKERKTKLVSTLFFVSPTRLSIRNLSRIEDETLTDFFLKKVCTFAAAVGMQNKIVLKDEGDPMLFPKDWTTNYERYCTKTPLVKSCKIFKEEVGGIRPPLETGTKEQGGSVPKKVLNKHKRKGFAFADFSEHYQALAALRILNNNPDFSFLSQGGLRAMKYRSEERSRLMVDFAIENAEKIHIQKKRRGAKQKR